MKEQMEIQISLTVDEANILLEALGNQPYHQVFHLISRIQQQASAQLNGRSGEMKPVYEKTENG